MSSELPRELIATLPSIVEELNTKVLSKGARKPEEAARIVKWRAERTTLEFRLECGPRVRLDAAALRIRKYLVPVLGKYRIGVRGLRVKNAVIELEGEFTVSPRVPLVTKVESIHGKTLAYLSELDERALREPYLSRLVRLLELKALKAKWGGKAEHWILLKQSKPREYKFTQDPNEILEKSGLMKHYSIGQWIYTPPLAWMLNRLQDLLIEHVLKPLGFVECILPKISPLEVALKSGHLKGAAHNMVFVSTPISTEESALEEWYDWVYITEKPDGRELQRFLQPPSYYVEYAQCPPFYQFLEKETLDPEKLPLKWYDRSGPSFRYEPAGGVRGLERLFEFHRVEIVWLGEPEQVIEVRDELLERYEYFMEKILDLEYRLAWVTPWFLVHAGEVREEKVDMRQPGTIDFEAYLPYKGPRDDPHAWLEIGNISVHGEKFTRPFHIRHKTKGKVLWTGCSGFGTERWLLAFLAQHGFDPDDWPEPVRRAMRGIPEPFEAVTYPKPEGRKVLEWLKSTLFSKLR